MSYRIMLVEDEMIVAMALRQRLESMGYEVVAHAISGAEAIRFALETNPQIVLMDIRIRGNMDGIEAAVRIRERQYVSIIYMTAFADQATLQRANIAEPYCYLSKPFGDGELRSIIEAAIDKLQEKKILPPLLSND